MKLLTVLCISMTLFAALLVSMGAARAAPATGNTYLVNSTADEQDQDLINPACLTISNTCTLRAAIMQANYAGGPATIIVPAGVYILSRVGIDDNAVAGDLDVAVDMTITGSGPALTVVDGNGAVTGDRVFQILSSATAVTMTGLTIRNGQLQAVAKGGGIYRDGSANVFPQPSFVLSDVVVAHNAAEHGAGIYVTGGGVDLENTTLWANSANSYGGGMLAQLADVTVRNSQIYSNSAAGNSGGGLELENSTWLVERSAIYSNTANVGAGIYNSALNTDLSAVPTLVDSSVYHNSAVLYAGGFGSDASFIISRTVVDSNSAGLNGGGIQVFDTAPTSTMVIAASTLSNNYAPDGGAIYYEDSCTLCSSVLSLRNSTLSGNSAHVGGGIYATRHAQVALDNTTVANNQVFRLFVNHYLAVGGGIFITSTAQVTAQNSLIGTNFFYDGFLSTPDDCYGPLVSLGYNLVETTTGCTGVPAFGDITAQDPLLGPLQNNGGSTPTHALLKGSPAINAGDLTGCKDETGSPLTADQRGWARPYPQGGRCDIGSFERGAYLYLPVVRR